jgi:hypothetical protein
MRRLCPIATNGDFKRYPAQVADTDTAGVGPAATTVFQGVMN